MSVKDKEFLYSIFRKEIKDRKIPLSLGKLEFNKSKYSFILNNNGGVIDDIIISKIIIRKNE